MAAKKDAILKQGKALVVSLDQGLEHGPAIFDLHSIDPTHVLDLALEADATAVVLTPGLAEQYYKGAYRDLPLIVKINGRTSIGHLNPDARQFCSVDRAVQLGASAVGYTLYDGSPAEAGQFVELGRIIEEAHAYGIPVVVWAYPRGAGVVHDTNTTAYAARVALELGADFVKVKDNGDGGGMSWIVKSAGRTGVLVADPEEPLPDEQLLAAVEAASRNGACGVAFGRSVWQHPRPLALLRALSGILFHGKSAAQVKKFLEE